MFCLLLLSFLLTLYLFVVFFFLFIYSCCCLFFSHCVYLLSLLWYVSSCSFTRNGTDMDIDSYIRDSDLVSVAQEFRPTPDQWQTRLSRFYQDHGLDKNAHEQIDRKQVEDSLNLERDTSDPTECLDTSTNLLKYLEYKVKTISILSFASFNRTFKS